LRLKLSHGAKHGVNVRRRGFNHLGMSHREDASRLLPLDLKVFNIWLGYTGCISAAGSRVYDHAIVDRTFKIPYVVSKQAMTVLPDCQRSLHRKTIFALASALVAFPSRTSTNIHRIRRPSLDQLPAIMKAPIHVDDGPKAPRHRARASHQDIVARLYGLDDADVA
jgi:hypothetical protein